MNHPPGTVIVPCQEQARYHAFTLALRSLKMPQGSNVVFGVGTSIVQNLNDAFEVAKPDSEWVWLLGDDHIFQPDMLMRLLDHNFDVIAPLCAQRSDPFALVHFASPLDGGLYKTVGYDQLPDEPFPVYTSGSALLIRKHVWEAVGTPLFINSPEAFREDALTEDLNLCNRIREAGFDIMVDPNLQLGHIGTMFVYPRKHAGSWGTSLEFRHGHTVFMEGGIDAGAITPEVVGV